MIDPNTFNILTFKLIGDFTIEIIYKDGKKQVIDFSKVKHKGWWKELEDPEYFKQVHLNVMDNLEWPNGQDFKPEHLYYWEKYKIYYQ